MRNVVLLCAWIGLAMAQDPLAEPDPFVGTFRGDGVRLEMSSSGGAYAGTLSIHGESYLVSMKVTGTVASGSYDVNGQAHRFTLTREAEGFMLTIGAATYRLTRRVSTALASQTDTFGLVLLEAMASGVPVVVSPEAGVRVGVRHGVTGFHAPDLPSFAASVGQLMNDGILRQQISAAARAFACSRTWDEVFEQLYQTYAHALETSGCKTGDRAIVESQTTS
jgi:hypothetical protein